MRALSWSRVGLFVALCLIGAACSGQGEGEAGSSEPAAVESPTSQTGGSDAELGIIEGNFDVGGYELYMRCSGTGSPTVVYLHGAIEDPSNPASSSGLTIQSLLEEQYRMCVYDRANTGESDSVPGPLDGESSVADLHALLGAAGIEPPYVLLAASFGGLIAHIYSATYPDEVVGMVYLDCSLPADYAEIDQRFFPGAKTLGDWHDMAEQIDAYAMWEQAYALEKDAPKIPLTYLASFDLPPEPEIAKAVRAGRREYTDMFSPGKFIESSTWPHYMEPAIPQRIAEEVEKVIAEA